MADDEYVFEMRLRSRYEGPDNEPADLALERLEDGSWIPVTLEPTALRFWWLTAAAFLCHHKYLYVNLAEQGHRLHRAEGRFVMRVTAGWIVRSLESHFEINSATQPSDDELAFVRERMVGCPISRNFPDAERSAHVVLQPPPS